MIIGYTRPVLAKYLRISVEDSNLEESNSIVNQRMLLDQYIQSKPDLRDMTILEYVDDGMSGTSFQRPGIQKILTGIKKEEINAIIVKDLSRFGRNCASSKR